MKLELSAPIPTPPRPTPLKIFSHADKTRANVTPTFYQRHRKSTLICLCCVFVWHSDPNSDRAGDPRQNCSLRRSYESFHFCRMMFEREIESSRNSATSPYHTVYSSLESTLYMMYMYMNAVLIASLCNAKPRYKIILTLALASGTFASAGLPSAG